jgi:hypothetical protein
VLFVCSLCCPVSCTNAPYNPLEHMYGLLSVYFLEKRVLTFVVWYPVLPK